MTTSADNPYRAHRKYYRIGGVTLQLESELAFRDDTLHPKFQHFEIAGPGPEMITVRHHFDLPDLEPLANATPVYDRPPWIIFQRESGWIYCQMSASALTGLSDRMSLANWLPRRFKTGPFFNDTRQQLGRGAARIESISYFDQDDFNIGIYNRRKNNFQQGNLHSLTMFPTDQILLARSLARCQGFILHAGGVVFSGTGLLFVGHSDAGKSTMVNLLKDQADILCDDRIIVRRRQDTFYIYGTWSHGDVAQVSGTSAPLGAVLFLKQAPRTRLVPMASGRQRTARILACLVKPFVTADWWQNTLILVESLVRTVPCYILEFDRSGDVVHTLAAWLEAGNGPSAHPKMADGSN